MAFGWSARAQKILSEGAVMYDVSVQTIGNYSTIYDAKAGMGVVLREFGGQKLMIRMNRQNWADKNKKYEGITYTNTEETKKIAGYECRKAIAKMADGSSFSVYYTNDVVMENKDYDGQFKNLPGVPLEFESVEGSIRVRYSATRVSFDPVPISRFEIPRSGYREMTYDEGLKAGSR
jgi:GLPGLI family protein